MTPDTGVDNTRDTEPLVLERRFVVIAKETLIMVVTVVEADDEMLLVIVAPLLAKVLVTDLVIEVDTDGIVFLMKANLMVIPVLVTG